MRATLVIQHSEVPATDLSEEQRADGQEAFNNYATALETAGALVSIEMFLPVAEGAEVTLAGNDPEDDTPAIRLGAPPAGAATVAGIIVVDVDTLDDAIEWAARCPAARWGSIAVRPAAISRVQNSWVA